MMGTFSNAQLGQFEISNDLSTDDYFASYVLLYSSKEIAVGSDFSVEMTVEFDLSRSWENISSFQVDGIYIHHFVDIGSEEVAVGSSAIWDGFEIRNASGNMFEITVLKTLALDNKVVVESQSVVEVVVSVTLVGYNFKQGSFWRDSYSATFAKTTGPVILPFTETSDLTPPKEAVDYVDRYIFIRNLVIAVLFLIIVLPVIYKRMRKRSFEGNP